jgi:hypothetical protein
MLLTITSLKTIDEYLSLQISAFSHSQKNTESGIFIIIHAPMVCMIVEGLKKGTPASISWPLV